MRVAVKLFGPLKITVADRPVPDSAWRGQKARALIKLLALAPGYRLPRDEVLDRLWPDHDTESGPPNLYNALSTARRALAPATVRLRDGILALNPDGTIESDLATFEAAAAAAHGSSDAAAYATAVALYGGDLLPDDRYADWAIARREGLQALYRDLLHALAARSIEGAPEVALDAFGKIAALDPTDEAAAAGLMRLHTRAGNRAAALRRFETLREALERELDAEPGAELRKLYGEIATEQFIVGTQRAGDQQPPVNATTMPATQRRDSTEQTLTLPNLPSPLTSFVGRDVEVAALSAYIRSGTNRLVTVTGVGGIGKTRLALAVAQTLQEDFAGAISFVELDRIASTSLLPDSVATIVGVQPTSAESTQAALVRALRKRRALLCLDNCEHVIDAVADLVFELLAACPQLQILATSREAIRLPGELAYPLGPLAVPTMSGSHGVAALATTPSVALFLDRVRRRQPQFSLAGDNIGAVIAICRRLDGLPLALELAAARTVALTITEIAARLDNMIETLTTRERGVPQRQRTMRAALDWSFALLTQSEQTVLRRLAVFSGTFDLGAVEAIIGDEPGPTNALDGVEALIDKSLVTVVTTTGGSRFRLLEPVSQYAREHLSSQEREEVAARHAAHFLALAEAGEVGLASAKQAAWQQRLIADEDNLRAALQWAITTAAVAHGVRLASALVPFWTTRGVYREGQSHFAALFDLLEGRDVTIPSSLLAKGLFGASMLAWRRGDHARANDYAARALAVFRHLGDDTGAAKALRLMANTALSQEQPAAAIPFLQEAEQLLRRGNHERDLALILNTLGEVARTILHDYGLAERHYREALALEGEGGAQERRAVFMGNLAAVLLYRGDVPGSLYYYRESLALRRALEHQRGIATCLEGVGSIAVAIGEPFLAARLYGSADALRVTIGAPRTADPADEAEHQRYLTSARLVTAPEEWLAHWRRGQTLAADDALAEFLAVYAT